MATNAKLGIIGVGSMGSAIAQRYLSAGWKPSAYDSNAGRMRAMETAGAQPQTSVASLIEVSDFVLLCLPTSDAAVRVLEQEILPLDLARKTIIDLGATDVQATRRIAAQIEGPGKHFLDAPVSGSVHRAQKGQLSIFVGGQQRIATRCEPIFKPLATKIAYCGPAGNGQILKAVEQIAVGLSQAAFLEALSYGASFGLEAGALWEALDQSSAARSTLEHLTADVVRQGGEQISVNFGELKYLLHSAQQNGQTLPLCQALQVFLKDSPPSVIERGQYVPSYWNAIKKKQ
ncbi:MAG TPA: NAD(P)-dependent oxidoreductase [Planctomycetota bacterium]|jgi:2-hydroxy-3-oxopropionate reductase